MDTVRIGDETYTKAGVIAREYGYTADYLGQLCRAGKVTSQLVGRTWYIDRTSLEMHREDKYKSVRQSEITSKINTKVDLANDALVRNVEKIPAVLSKKTIKTFDSLTQQTHQSFVSAGKIVYESDNYDLYPRGLKKPEVSSQIRPITSVPVRLEAALDVPIQAGNPSILALEFTDLPEVLLTGSVPVQQIPELFPVDDPVVYTPDIPAAEPASHFFKKVSSRTSSQPTFTPSSIPRGKGRSVKLLVSVCLLAMLCSTLVLTVDSYTVASGAAAYTSFVFNPAPLLQFFLF